MVFGGQRLTEIGLGLLGSGWGHCGVRCSYEKLSGVGRS